MLRIYMFQCLQAVTEGGEPLDLGSPTMRSLFAYLVLHRSRPADRRRLAFLFWPGATESAARRNLRQYFHHLRRLLEPAGLAQSFFDAEGSTLQINPAADLWTDVDDFRRLTRPNAPLEDLAQGVELYGGPLLDELYDDWIVDERQHLHQAMVDTLDRLSLAYQSAGRLGEALQAAQHWVAIEPLDEKGHRRLMSLYAVSGDRNRALQHYRTLQNTLSAELGAEPTPETAALYQSLQGGTPEVVKTGPLPRLPRPETARPAPAKSNLPLVGRRAELERLRSAMEQARAGRGCLMLVSGESGIGKTRLVQEVLALHASPVVLHTACHELEAVIPYAAMRPLVQQALALLPESFWHPVQPWMASLAVFSPPLAERYPYLALGSLTPGTGAGTSLPAADAQQVGFALVQLLARMCEQQTGPDKGSSSVLVILDDLHWADSLVWELLIQLGRLAAQERLVVIGVCRHEDLAPDRSRTLRQMLHHNLLTELPLARLSLQETAALAAEVDPHQPADDFFIHRLHQETGGNPFFIVEMLQSLKEAGMTAAPGFEEGSSRPVPPVSKDELFLDRQMPLSIQRLVESRLDRLSPASHDLLSATAAIGQAFSLTLLESVVDNPAAEVVAAIEDWLRRRLVLETAGGYDFSHDKIRQVAYHRLSRARREYIHRQIGEALESSLTPPDAATLAHHFARSDQPLRALPYLARAGEQALSVRSYSEARQIGQQALNLLGRIPGPQQHAERIDLSLQLAQAHAFTGELNRAGELLSQAEGLCHALNDPTRLAQVCYRSAQVAWLRGLPAAAGDYARRVQRLVENNENPGLQRAALRMLGRVGIALSTFDDAIAYLAAYVQIDPSGRTLPDLPIVLGYLAVALARVGSWERARETSSQSLALAEQSVSADTRRFARMQRAFVYAAAADWERCWETLSEEPGDEEPALDGGEFTPLRFMQSGLRGRVIAHRGDPEQGIEVIQTALALQTHSEYRAFYYLPRLYLAEALILAGKPAAALEAASLGVEQARQAGDRWAQGLGLRYIGDALGRTANPPWPRIEDSLIESMNYLRSVRGRPDLARTYLALRRLYDRAGQIAWAVDCHFRATTIFEELGMQAELRQAQGIAVSGGGGAVVIPGLSLRGPHQAA